MSWTRYLRGFHDQRPGVTEGVLSRSRAGDCGDPYDWLLAAVPARGRTLDLACGSAPLRRKPSERRYVGVDTSASELAAAQAAGADRLVRATATAIPLAAGSVDVVLCSMALMVLTPLTQVLAEIGRVLAPDGLLVATVPDHGPLRPADLPIVTGLMAALGRRLTYPGDRHMPHLGELLDGAGLRPESDRRRRFAYRLCEPQDADRFLASLYLPGLRPVNYRLASGYLRALVRVRAELPIPIRRITARRAAPAGTAHHRGRR